MVLYLKLINLKPNGFITNMRRDVFQAIADPTRREIINILANRHSNLNDLISHFDISRPGVVKHVRILEECGLVEVRKKGRERICYTHLDNLADIALWVHQYRRFWNKRLDTLEELLLQDKEPPKNT